MNVLGAMFFKSYEDVQAESYEIWQKLRYNLIMEYSEMPPMPPPFVILWDFSLFLKWCLKAILPRSYRKTVDKLFSFLTIKGCLHKF